jgi:hypothetical protein
MSLSFPDTGKAFSLHIRKGANDGKAVIAWSSIADCLGDRCRIEELCAYDKRGKCTVQVQFLQVTLEMLRSTNPKLEEDQAWRIGMHLLPLYKTLCKLYMDELAVCHPTYTTEKGTRQSHPVYKEIRDTLKMIMMVWKDIGLEGAASGGGGVNMGKRGLYVPDTGYVKGSMRE